jgi:hypothetical protein
MASRASGELAVTAFLRVRVAMLWLGRLTQFSPVLLTASNEVGYLLTTRDFELGKGTFCVSPGKALKAPTQLYLFLDGFGDMVLISC